MNKPAAWPHPTANPALDRLIAEWFASVQAIFGPHLLAACLDGSLTSGDFDQDSDVDFVLVTDGEIAPEVFAALQDVHTRLAEKDALWGINASRAGLGAREPGSALAWLDRARLGRPQPPRP